MDELSQYRQEIDSIDNQIIELLGKRQKLVKKVTDYKKKHNLPALQPERWQEVLEEKKKIGEKNQVPTKLIQEIWDTIHKHSLKYQNSNGED